MRITPGRTHEWISKCLGNPTYSRNIARTFLTPIRRAAPFSRPARQKPQIAAPDGAANDGIALHRRITKHVYGGMQAYFTPISGPNVDKELLKSTRTGAALLIAAALAGCGTPPAKNFGGPWKPVNHFQNKPTEIPLNPAYAFYASPMDETLKTMLARWARDSGRQLSYRIPFDVTLYQPVAGIRTTDVDDAVAQLNSIYAAQGVFVTADARHIEVAPASPTRSDAAPANAADAAVKSAASTDAK